MNPRLNWTVFVLVISGGGECHDFGPLTIKAPTPQFVLSLGTVRLCRYRVALFVTLWTVEND